MAACSDEPDGSLGYTVLLSQLSIRQRRLADSPDVIFRQTGTSITSASRVGIAFSPDTILHIVEARPFVQMRLFDASWVVAVVQSTEAGLN
jgi:hypothetical protein